MSDPHGNPALEQAVRAALRSEPGLDLQRYPVHVAVEHEAVALDGEVATVAAKKLALLRAMAVPGVAGIVDRLHVVPAQAMGDRAIRDHVCHALIDEPALLEVGIRSTDGGSLRQALRDEAGTIEVAVADGIVTLDGRVASLAHKRLAGVLAWWVPGSRDVVNGIAVEPEEADSDESVTEAVRVALDKDPFVDQDGIGVHTCRWVVTLSGTVPSDSQRTMAEADAWYVFGVDRVINRIEVTR